MCSRHRTLNPLRPPFRWCNHHVEFASQVMTIPHVSSARAEPSAVIHTPPADSSTSALVTGSSQPSPPTAATEVDEWDDFCPVCESKCGHIEQCIRDLGRVDVRVDPAPAPSLLPSSHVEERTVKALRDPDACLAIRTPRTFLGRAAPFNPLSLLPHLAYWCAFHYKALEVAGVCPDCYNEQLILDRAFRLNRQSPYERWQTDIRFTPPEDRPHTPPTPER